MLKRIILHWSAGAYKPNYTDLTHYHYVVDGFGKISEGVYKPEDNINCTNNYAAHTKLGNTGSIGIAMCAMQGFKNKSNVGDYPITKIQAESFFNLCSKLCKKYKISVNKENIMSHKEFNKRKNIKTGKIDIIYLPPYSDISENEIESFMLNKINWYLRR